MLLSSRAAMMSLIAVPAVIFANVLTAVAGAQEAPVSGQVDALQFDEPVSAGGEQRFATRYNSRQPSAVRMGVPRQVLLIDLNPVLDFGTSLEQDLSTPGETQLNFSAVQSAGSVSLHHGTAGASPFAAALAPRPSELARVSAVMGRKVSPDRSLIQPPIAEPLIAELAEVQPRQWQAPYPSLGQLQLDRQLRRYLAYLDTVGQPDILIVGGQGAAQGVDPLALQDSLGDRGYGDLKVFNWGISQASAQTVEWLLTELLTPQQLPKLVVWAETSVALNGSRQDTGFAKISASPGQRFLQRGLLPQLAAQEKSLAQQLGQILSRPIERPLPAGVLSLTQSPSGVTPQVEAKAVAVTKQELKPEVSEAPVASRIAQSASVQGHSPIRALPLLKPQAFVSTTPVRAAVGETGETSGFRLVNWCRNTQGPCQTQDGQSAALVQAAPAWLQQVQADQTARRANRGPSPVRRLQNSTVASAPLPSITLPNWPQSQASQRFLQAMGFQSVSQRLGVTQPSGRPWLRGDQDRNYRNFSLQGEQNRALHRLVKFGQQQEMAIAFVQLPLSQQYLDIERRSREEAFRTYLDVAAQMTPLNLVALPDEGLPWNEALFARPHHLNRYGAAVLSWQIGQSLDEQLLKALP